MVLGQERIRRIERIQQDAQDQVDSQAKQIKELKRTVKNQGEFIEEVKKLMISMKNKL